jgi:hypothetical protein
MHIKRSEGAGVVTLLLTAASWCGSAQAGTILVCSTCNHTTIQSAVNDAVDNDIIKIAVGRYVENVTVIGKSLTFLGDQTSEPRGATVVVAAGRGPVFTLGSGVAGDPAKQMLLVSLTISGGNHTGGSGVGGGVQVRSGAWLRLVGCTVRGNYANSGGGVGINSPGSPASAITDSLITENDAPGTPHTVGFGGGVHVSAGSTVGIANTTIALNTSGGGGGIFGEQGSTLNIATTTVAQNRSNRTSAPASFSDGDGGGMETRGDFAISDSDFTGNVSAGNNGGGGLSIIISDSGPHTIARTTFSHNTVATETPPLRGGAILAAVDPDAIQAGTYSIDHSYIEQNQVQKNNAGGGVWNGSGVSAVITSSVISDNVGGNVCDPSGCH